MDSARIKVVGVGGGGNNATNGGICCQHRVEEPNVRRREVLTFVGTVVGMEMMTSSGPFTGNAAAADLIQRRQRSEFLSNIKGTLNTALEANPELIPSILTLALNDAITYDKATKSGGPNVSIRWSSEISRPENIGLSAALDLLIEAKKEIDSYSKGGPLSYADLIQYGAQTAVKKTYLDAAVRKCGGNVEKGRLLYTAYGSTGQESNPYCGIDCNDVGTNNMQEQNVFETLIGKQQQIFNTLEELAEMIFQSAL